MDGIWMERRPLQEGYVMELLEKLCPKWSPDPQRTWRDEADRQGRL